MGEFFGEIMEVKVGDYYFYEFQNVNTIEKVIEIKDGNVYYSAITPINDYIRHLFFRLHDYNTENTFKIHPTLVKLWQLDKLFEK